MEAGISSWSREAMEDRRRPLPEASWWWCCEETRDTGILVLADVEGFTS